MRHLIHKDIVITEDMTRADIEELAGRELAWSDVFVSVLFADTDRCQRFYIVPEKERPWITHGWPFLIHEYWGPGE